MALRQLNERENTLDLFRYFETLDNSGQFKAMLALLRSEHGGALRTHMHTSVYVWNLHDTPEYRAFESEMQKSQHKK